MGCFDSLRRQQEVSAEHKFEYINLKDFKKSSFYTRLAYLWVYLSILIIVLCVVADTYTAVILLVFNRWSSQIKPIIPFGVAKIIFAVCIGLSYFLYLIDWWHAAGVIKRGGVADAYMDTIALRWHSIRGGKGKEDTGWKRFLVFARLTEKRGGRDYVALFTYFSFKGWARVLFAEGPRVVINTLTLVSVIRADLIPDDTREALSVIGRFFENVGHLYKENIVQALILGTMTFTTIFWLFTIIQLTVACNMYLCYLIRVIGETSLKDYCRRRVDKRMTKIVIANHKRGLKNDDFREPTLPVIVPQNVRTSDSVDSVTKTPVSTLNRQPTIPDLWRGQSSHPLNRSGTTPTVASSIYSRSSVPPPPHVSPYANYSPPRPQHSTHSSSDSHKALTSLPAENPYSDPVYPSPIQHSPPDRFYPSPRGRQEPVPAYQRRVYSPPSEWPITDPVIGRSATAPPGISPGMRRWQEDVGGGGTEPPGWNERWGGPGERGNWPQQQQQQQPQHQNTDYIGRSATAAPREYGRRMEPPNRSRTAGPGGW